MITPSAILIQGDGSRANDMALGGRNVVSLNGSPATLQNTLPSRIMVLISFGTVTSIEFSRDGVVFDLIGLLAGQFFLNSGDWLRITYLLAPTIVYYPF